MVLQCTRTRIHRLIPKSSTLFLLQKDLQTGSLECQDRTGYKVKQCVLSLPNFVRLRERLLRSNATNI